MAAVAKILTLPNELQDLILAELHWKDHFTCALVCRLWSTILQQPAYRRLRYEPVPLPRKEPPHHNTGFSYVNNVLTLLPAPAPAPAPPNPHEELGTSHVHKFLISTDDLIFQINTRGESVLYFKCVAQSANNSNTLSLPSGQNIKNLVQIENSPIMNDPIFRLHKPDSKVNWRVVSFIYDERLGESFQRKVELGGGPDGGNISLREFIGTVKESLATVGEGKPITIRLSKTFKTGEINVVATVGFESGRPRYRYGEGRDINMLVYR